MMRTDTPQDSERSMLGIRGRLRGIALAAALLLAAMAGHGSPALAADNYGDVTTTLDGDWTNYGTVTTVAAPAMRSTSGQMSVNAPSGVLNASGFSFAGIYSSDNSAGYNFGGIGTSLSYGMHAYNNSQVCNFGDVNTTGNAAYGLYADTSSWAYNFGSIGTTGNSAHGIMAQINSTGDNSGSISTTGNSAHGIYALTSGTIYNSGSIRTSGSSSYGIFASASSQAYSTGTIRTTGADGVGMYALSDSQAYNYGTITTTGAGGYGLAADTNSVAHNYGVISTTADDSHGLSLAGSSLGYNGGSISTTGADAYGIRSDSSTVYNTGSISAANSHAIYAADSAIHLMPGTRILAGDVYGLAGTTNTLYLDESGTANFDIAGTWASLTKTQNGTWTLTRNISGTLNALTLQGGVLALASGVSLNVAGNYAQNPGSTLALVANGATTPIAAAGTATLDGALSVDVAASGVGATTLLSAAGGVTGTFAQYASANPNFSVRGLTYGANTVSATTAFAPRWDASSMATMSTLGAARTFSTVAQSRSLTLLADGGSQNQDREILLASAGSLEGLLSPRDPQWGLYLQPVHGTTARSSHGGGEGYNADLTGLEFGLDRKIGRHWVLGVMAGIGTTDIEFNGSSFVSNDTEEQTLYTLGAYAGYTLDDWLFSDTLSQTYVDQSSKRNAGLSQTASAGYDSWLTRNQLLAVYRWKPAEGLEIAPRAGLDLTYLHRGGFSETGATNAVSYRDLDKVFADASLGLRATRSWTLDSGVDMSLYLGGDVVHALGSGDITVRQYLPTTSALVTTMNDADRFNAECGVKFGRGPASLTLGYNGQYGKTTDSHAVFGMLRMEF